MKDESREDAVPSEPPVPSPRRTGERKSPDLRREEILDSTIRLVARKGFAAVTLRDVATDVGVAHGLLRHYFGDRDELIAAAFDRAAAEEMATATDADGDTLSPAALIRVVAEWLTATPRDHYLVWIDAWSEAPRNTALLDSLRRHHLDCERRLTRLIEEGADAKVFTLVKPAADISSFLTALADGLAVQQHAIGVIDAESYDNTVFEYAEHALGLPPRSLSLADVDHHTRGSWVDA